MTLEDKIWQDLITRKQFCTARQISRKLTISISHVRTLLNAYHKRGILEKIIKNKTNFYRIKP